MIEYIIYSITNPIDNEVIYIGQTVNLKRRIAAHCYTHKFIINKPLKAIMDSIFKVGLRPTFNIVDTVSSEPLKAENKWINHYRDLGFNLLNIKNLRPVGYIKPQNTTNKKPISRHKLYRL